MQGSKKTLTHVDMVSGMSWFPQDELSKWRTTQNLRFNRTRVTMMPRKVIVSDIGTIPVAPSSPPDITCP